MSTENRDLKHTIQNCFYGSLLLLAGCAAPSPSIAEIQKDTLQTKPTAGKELVIQGNGYNLSQVSLNVVEITSLRYSDRLKGLLALNGKCKVLSYSDPLEGDRSYATTNEDYCLGNFQ